MNPPSVLCVRDLFRLVHLHLPWAVCSGTLVFGVSDLVVPLLELFVIMSPFGYAYSSFLPVHPRDFPSPFVPTFADPTELNGRWKV